MKNVSTSVRSALGVATLTFTLAAAGCKNGTMASDEPRKPIPLAPVGVSSAGIGGPGGASADTRATGSVATGEGNAPLEVRSGVAPVTAAPGSVSGTAGHY